VPQIQTVKLILAEKYLAHFIKQAWDVVEPKTQLRWGWHIDCICEHLEAITSGDIQKLLINVPPRNCKSMTVCVFWPAWEWGPQGKPETRWLFSSYAEQLSKRDSLKCRRLITSKWYQERWGDRFYITTDQNEKMRYENNKTGYRVATSVGGMGTGEGGSRIVCLPYEAVVVTDAGNIPIGKIVSDRLGVSVASFNHDTSQIEFQKIEEWEDNEVNSKFVEIEFKDGNKKKIRCTAFHPIYTRQRGYVPAIDLREDDECLIVE
jgi:hypothetical protein